jgi:hypothetical protein
VARPINAGTSTESKQIGFGNLAFDQFTAFDKMNAAQYCDLQGENCFSASAVGPATGNQITYLKRPRTLYDSSFFRTPGEYAVEFDFNAAGYPPNMVRTYLAVNRIKRLGTEMPIAYITAPVTNNIFPVGNDGTVSGIKGDWYSVKDGHATFKVNCYDSSCGTSDLRNYIDIRAMGFECSGPCQDPISNGDGQLTEKMYSCMVNFNMLLNGYRATANRRIFGDKNDLFAIGIGFRDNDQGNNNPWLPYSEQLAAYSWGAAWNHHSDRAIAGYFDIHQYAATKPTLDAKNVFTWVGETYDIDTLRLIDGGYTEVSDAGKSNRGLSMNARVFDCNE